MYGQHNYCSVFPFDSSFPLDLGLLNRPIIIVSRLSAYRQGRWYLYLRFGVFIVV